MVILIGRRELFLVKSVLVKTRSQEIILTTKLEKRLTMLSRPFQNLMHDAILTAMDNVIILRVEMTVRSITSSSRLGPNSTFQNPDRRDFIGNTKNTPLKSASSRLDLNIDHESKRFLMLKISRMVTLWH